MGFSVRQPVEVGELPRPFGGGEQRRVIDLVVGQQIAEQQVGVALGAQPRQPRAEGARVVRRAPGEQPVEQRITERPELRLVVVDACGRYRRQARNRGIRVEPGFLGDDGDHRAGRRALERHLVGGERVCDGLAPTATISHLAGNQGRNRGAGQRSRRIPPHRAAAGRAGGAAAASEHQGRQRHEHRQGRQPQTGKHDRR